MSSKNNPYWRSNIRILTVLLSIWAIVSFGFSILLVDFLDRFTIGGFRLGFWMSQQGSIYVYLILIGVYIFLMDRLDRQYSVSEQELEKRNQDAERGQKQRHGQEEGERS